MVRALQRVAFFAAALLLPLTVQAQRLERTFPADSETVLEIRNHAGQVKVRGWSLPQVKVVAVRASRAAEPHLEQKANRIHVHTHLLDTSAPAADRMVDYEVWAPPDTEVSTYLETGSVLVENFTEDVRIDAPASSVRLFRVDGHASVNTLSGSAEVERCSGRIEVTSVSGSLRFRGNESGYIVASTTSGDIFYDGDFLRGGSYEFRTHNGTIELMVPATASFELNARSSEGEVSTDFPLTPRTHGRAPQSVSRSLLGTVHSGEAFVRVTSFGGKIRVRKR